MRATLLALAILLALSGCNKQEAPLSKPAALSRQAVAADKKAAPFAEVAEAAEGGNAGTAQVQRNIELHHAIDIEVDADQLASVWRSRLDACKQPACEVVSATIENQSGDTRSAQLSLRIVPAQAGSLLETLQSSGRLTRHEMSQTDRTNEMVDYQARLNNQKALRDRLRAMAAGRVDKVHDLLEVERELARVQGEIDSLEGQIRATLAVTEKINFEIHFQTSASLARPGSWQPVREAWHDAGKVFAGSVAALLYFVAGGLPWFFVLALGIWGLRRLLRWRKARKQGA